MFQFLDSNLKKICYSILKERWPFSLNLQAKKANNLLLSIFFALALVEHDLTTISSCSHLCWHDQRKPESKQDVTALLAPCGWGPGERFACSTLVSVYPLAITMLFILHALNHAVFSQHLSSQELLDKVVRVVPDWLPTGNTPAGLGKSALVLEKVCSNGLSYCHFCYTFAWKLLSCRYGSAVWVVMAVFLLLRLLISSNICLTGGISCARILGVVETLILEALSNHRNICND